MIVLKSLRGAILTTSLLVLCSGNCLADLEDMSHLEEESRSLEFSAGHRWVDTDSNPGRAAEYSYLDDSPTFDLTYKETLEEGNLFLDGTYLNDNDYSLSGGFDHKALLRFSARSERFYHNLDHIPYENDPGARPPSPGFVEYIELDSGEDYGRRVNIDEVKVRGKLPTYPAHINLSYWRMEKKGKEQLRFVDESCFGSCHMQSNTRKVDKVTEEVNASIDAHLGPVDIAFLQTLREFREKGDTPLDDFNAHGLLGRPPGQYIHDEAPDSKLAESTFMINLPPSGGFVTSASYTFGTRENESDTAAEVRENPETEYQKLATDVTYTPSENWIFNFRYRMLDLDQDNPASLSSNTLAFNNFGNPIPVRESIDIDRNTYTAFVSYRPTRSLTFKGEYEHEDTERNNTGTGFHSSLAPGGIMNLNWDLPEHEKEDRLRLTFYSRLMEKSALKLNGWFEYKTIDNPAYSTTLSDSNELFLSASYNPGALWGTTGSINILRGENDEHTATLFDGAPVEFPVEREEERENLALGAWLILNEIFSADLNYSWMHADIDHDVIFGTEHTSTDPEGLRDFAILDNSADYEQEVHTISAGINFRAMEKVNCRLEGYHIRSSAEFSPGFGSRGLDFNEDGILDTIVTADDLKEISEVDLRQNGLKARVSWHISEMLMARFEYTYDDYEDKNSDVFDGSAQTFIASLTGTF